MGETLRNWAGNIDFHAARVHRPSSLDQLRGLVADAEAVRVLGTGHSFNRIADTDGDLILLDGLPAELEIDAAAHTATVPAGMRLAQLAAQLQDAGFALANLPSLPHISLVGACATGTHGSGNGNQGLAALVRAIRLIGPDGQQIELVRGEDADFDGAVVNLGALGVVTSLTVDVQPSFEIAQYVYRDMPLGRLIERHADVFAAGYSVSAFTDWAGGRATVWRKVLRSVDGGHGGDHAAVAQPEHVDQEWFGARLADEAVHPVPGMPAGSCTQQLGVPGPWHERLPHFRPEFTPSSGKELQSEFFVAREAAPEAIEAVRRLGRQIAPVLQISEIRTIAADSLWLSPSYGRDSVALHFTWIDDLDAVTPVLAAIERDLMPLAARPHWGKVYLGAPEATLAGYEKADDFRGLLGRLDPHGKFRNEYVQRLFG